MDLRMPDGDGVSATSRILATAPESRVIVLTTYETDRDILRAVEAGAAGYLLKDTSRAELLAAIVAAARGETVLSPVGGHPAGHPDASAGRPSHCRRARPRCSTWWPEG